MNAGEPNLRRGCLMGLIVLVLLGSGLFYMWWQVYSKLVPPEELKPYATRESTMELIKSKAPAPGPDARLTESDVEFYIDALDSINVGWDIFKVAWDSMMATRNPDDDFMFDPLELDELGVLFFQMNLHARHSLINYLNQEGKSWDEYLWVKRRVIVASDISQSELTDTLRAFIERYAFEVEEEEKNRLASPDLFGLVEEIRRQGVDSIERAFVKPYRDTLLTHGLHSLTQAEEMFYGEKD
ncbi:MAG: hypothetical protein J4G05_01935 [Chlorobi bacterium]|nr:hypothetical protein [Chlorobiota bacterium]